VPIEGVALLNNSSSLEHLESSLQDIYSNKVGVEFGRFLNKNPSESQWMYNTYEECMSSPISTET
jgi:2-oxoglutarate dehydrogenase complex dehydrogenase (E1) component-like enzyme